MTRLALSSIPTIMVALTTMLSLAAATTPKAFDFDGLFQWVRSHPDSVIHESQDFRARDPTDARSPYGMYATADLAKGTVLLRVPWDLIIRRGKKYVRGDSPDLAGISCGAVRKLWKEWAKYFYHDGDEAEVEADATADGDADAEDTHDEAATSSKYGPYLEYLKYALSAQGDGSSYTIPSAWSKPGQELLLDWLDQIVLPNNDMVTWVTEDWDFYCKKPSVSIPREDELAVVAAVVQQGEQDAMVPLSNFYNHRNYIGNKGHFFWTNADAVLVRKEYYEITATRDIKAGEEIYMSFTDCAACGERADTHGLFELFRDYGFVETFPQRWVFEEEDIDFDLDFIPGPDGDKANSVYKVDWVANQDTDKTDINLLREKLRALELFGTMEWRVTAEDNDIPAKELASFWELHQATTIAVTEAIKYLENHFGDHDEDEDTMTDEEMQEAYCLGGRMELPKGYPYVMPQDRRPDVCVMVDPYVDLNATNHVEKAKKMQVCDNFEELMFLNHTVTEIRQSHYQKMTFDFNEQTENVCFDLDGTLQICDNYRPQYHEYAVHYPAQYLDSIERVLFIGGGDSMLLHEILKYPSLKQVIGLELDQQVTRKCFKYFETQPLFHDPRVEWWFGDATKSLLLLPTEFYMEGSFDLVLVDLSETVTALTVNNKLDVLGALALLVKPDGILVKNEHYFDKLSRFFNYTQQINYDSPILCGQSMSMGSNSIDFMRHGTKSHGVKTLLMKTFETVGDKMEFIENYGQNNYDLRHRGVCTEPKDQDDAADAFQDTSPTVTLAMHVVGDVEGVSVSEDVDALIARVGKENGLTFINTISNEPTVVVFEEGYVSATVWPDLNYCALDVHMWGSYDKVETIRDALIAALGADPRTTQTYRVIVGGMYGYPGFDEQQSRIGPPQSSSTRYCHDLGKPASKEEAAAAAKSSLSVFLETMPSLLMAPSNLTAVFCGPKDGAEPCEAFETISSSVIGADASRVIPIWGCDDLIDIASLQASQPTTEVLNGISAMTECEGRVRKQLEDSAKEHGMKYSQIVMDPSVEYPMMKIIYNALRSPRSKRLLIDSNSIIVSAQSKREDMFRANIIPRLRLAYNWHPIFSVQTVIRDSSHSTFVNAVSILSVGDPEFLEKLAKAEQSINERLQSTDGNGDELQVIRLTAGEDLFDENHNPPRFNHSHYDFMPAREQFDGQSPIGRQTIFQIDANDEPNVPVLFKAMEAASSWANFTSTHSAMQNHGIGDGAIVMRAFEQGSAIAVWGGLYHVDLILFSTDESEDLATGFGEAFVSALTGGKLGLRDDQPRGVGRVINFQVDIDEDVSNADNSDKLVKVNHD